MSLYISKATGVHGKEIGRTYRWTNGSFGNGELPELFLPSRSRVGVVAVLFLSHRIVVRQRAGQQTQVMSFILLFVPLPLVKNESDGSRVGMKQYKVLISQLPVSHATDRGLEATITCEWTAETPAFTGNSPRFRERSDFRKKRRECSAKYS